jgi:hypothetical protein
MYHPFYHILTNELYTESSSPWHHQPVCENPHQFQQSVRESIALNHLSTVQCIPVLIKVGRHSSESINFCSLNEIKVVGFCSVFLSDVLCVEVFLLPPTASGGDDAGPRFCEPLPTSSPRFRDIALITLDEFPPTATFCTLFFCWNPTSDTRKSRWSRVGTSNIILDFYPVICLVRWLMVRIGKVGREVVKRLDYQW